MTTEICPVCNKPVGFMTRLKHGNGVITHHACQWDYVPRNLNKTQNSEISESNEERERSTSAVAHNSATTSSKELPDVVFIFILLSVLAVIGGFIITAIFLSHESFYLASIWFIASLVQAAFFAAIASGLNYLSEIAANTKVLADARLEAVQSKNSDTSV